MTNQSEALSKNKTRNNAKIAGLLLLLILVILALVWGPLTSDPPDPGPNVRTPSMENIPDGTQLQLEVKPNPKE